MLCTIEHFSFYLISISLFVLTTRHYYICLIHFNNSLWRWRIRLADYNSQIVHVEERQNVIAKALSRQSWTDTMDCS